MSKIRVWLFAVIAIPLTCLLGTACAVDSGEDGSTDGQVTGSKGVVKKNIKVATFNVMTLFDTVCDSGSCGGSNYEDQPSLQKYQQKLQQIANGIKSMDADIVLLQEVENEKTLKDLHSLVASKYSGYTIAESGKDGSLDTAMLYNGKLLAKFAFSSLTKGTTATPYFTRRLLGLHLAINPQAQQNEEPDLIVFCGHFISQLDDANDARRLAEALTTREILEEQASKFPQALVVFGGDLNDSTGSEAINALENSSVLLRVASDLPKDEQATYYYQRKYYALDHLFVALNEGGQYVGKSAQVFKNSTGGGFASSDHYALRAEFVLASGGE